MPLNSDEIRLLNLSEPEFHLQMREIIRQSGEIGDVFSVMVQHNVGEYILQQFWPEKYQVYKEENVRLAFCAAEEAWRGNIDNVISELKSTGDKYIVKGAKSYVMTADAFLVLSRMESDFALVWLSSDQIAERILRDEPNTVLKDRNDKIVIQHYKIKFETEIASSNFIRLKRRSYARAGIQIPWREITSLAFLAGGICDYLQLTGFSDRIRTDSVILEERKSGQIDRQTFQNAAKTLLEFKSILKDRQVSPFWSGVFKMATFSLK